MMRYFGEKLPLSLGLLVFPVLLIDRPWASKKSAQPQSTSSDVPVFAKPYFDGEAIPKHAGSTLKGGPAYREGH